MQNEIEKAVSLHLAHKGSAKLYDVYRFAEDRLRDIDKTKPVEPQSYTFQFEMRDDSSVTFSFNENKAIDLTLKVGNKVLHMDSKTTIVSNVLNFIQKDMQNLMDQNALAFAPKYDKNFEEIVLSSVPGDIIHFGTKMAVVCVEKSDNKHVFHSQFKGDLEHIRLESFLNGDVYTVTDSDKMSLQKFYNAAYNELLSAVEFKNGITNTLGEQRLLELEMRIDNNNVAEHFVGPIHLRALNRNGNITWYDSNAKTLSREKVATILGWAEKSIANIAVSEHQYPKCYESASDGVKLPDWIFELRSEYAKKVAKAANTGKFDEIPKIAAEYEAKTNDHLTLNISGLERDTDGNFEAKTYTFANGKIFETTYEDHDFGQFPFETFECDISDFRQFMSKKYSDALTILAPEAEKNTYVQSSEDKQTALKNYSHYQMVTKEMIVREKDIFATDELTQAFYESIADDFDNETIPATEILGDEDIGDDDSYDGFDFDDD